jgi:hypothetical protein
MKVLSLLIKKVISIFFIFNIFISKIIELDKKKDRMVLDTEELSPEYVKEEGYYD